MKLGFACKFLNPESLQLFPFKSPTRKRFTGLNQQDRVKLVYEYSTINLTNLLAIFQQLAQLPDELRMMRIGSDLLPLYTVPEALPLYQDFLPDRRRCLSNAARWRARTTSVSFHPGQYSVLASDNPDVVTRALEDVEYHALCAKMMGYGKTFRDFKINVHMNGRGGFDGFKTAFSRLSPEAQNMLTVENDEISCSLDDVLRARDLCPIVLDIHHHWVKENAFIQPDDARIELIKESARRPARSALFHFREGLIPEQGFPDQQTLAWPNQSYGRTPISISTTRLMTGRYHSMRSILCVR